MKKYLALILCALLLAGCSPKPGETAQATEVTLPEDYVYAPLLAPSADETDFVSRFASETLIVLSDDGITVDGGGETDTVFTSHDIIYYEDKDVYESGNPYGEGEETDKHTAEEATAHTVVNITAPGTYRVSGTLSSGQIRIDLGEDACEDPNAVVELILENADITCTVAPAVLFLNVYECDSEWSTDTASPNVDTTAAGANLILEGENTVTGSHVAKIFKDKDGEKKLWKQDGAIYSYMSLNVYGPGSLELTADNEGLDTELHLSIWGGSITIRSDNDGINTNEDGVSVTAIHGGKLHIIAGLGAEGDGIDSNGYLVIDGGIVVSAANPASDAGLDSDLGSYIHGGTVIAMGSSMDWAESDSGQVTLNLQFSQYRTGALVVTRPDGTVIFAYDPTADEIMGTQVRMYMGAIVSCANFVQGESYQLWQDGTVTGEESGGLYDPASVTAFEGGKQMAYTGTDVTMGPGGFGGPGGNPPELPEGQQPGDFTPPEADFTIPGGERPGNMGGEPFGGQQPPDGEMPTMPEGEIPSMPEGEIPGGFDGQRPGDRGQGQSPDGSSGSNTLFYMQDKVNFFSGLTPIQ